MAERDELIAMLERVTDDLENHHAALWRAPDGSLERPCKTVIESRELLVRILDGAPDE